MHFTPLAWFRRSVRCDLPNQWIMAPCGPSSTRTERIRTASARSGLAPTLWTNPISQAGEVLVVKLHDAISRTQSPVHASPEALQAQLVVQCSESHDDTGARRVSRYSKTARRNIRVLVPMQLGLPNGIYHWLSSGRRQAETSADVQALLVEGMNRSFARLVSHQRAGG